MTAEEAMGVIDGIPDDWLDTNEKEALEVARTALRKMVPKQRNVTRRFYVMEGYETLVPTCPLCGYISERKYCPDCGQAMI